MSNVPDEAGKLMDTGEGLVKSMVSSLDLSQTSQKLYEASEPDKATVLPDRDGEVPDFRTQCKGCASKEVGQDRAVLARCKGLESGVVVARDVPKEQDSITVRHGLEVQKSAILYTRLDRRTEELIEDNMFSR